MGAGARLRVVLVSYEFPPRFGGGIGTCTRTLSAGLARRGHEVTVLTVGDVAAEVTPCEGDGVGGSGVGGDGGKGGVRVVRLGEEGAKAGTLRSWWGGSERAAAWLEEEGAGADVVEFPDYRGEALAYLRRREAGGGKGERGDGRGGPRCIVRLHTPLAVLNKYNASRRRDRVLEAMEIEAMLLADGVVSSSHALTAEVRGCVPELGEVGFSRYGVEESGTGGNGTGGNGTEGSGDRGIEPGRGAGDGGDVVYVGRLEERKGVEVLVRATGAFLRAWPRARVHLVGGDTEWGPGEASTRARLEGMLGEEARGRVDFHGAVGPDRVREIVGGARVCIFPSLFEAGPYACLEAMALGKPVIGTDRGGMAEMIADGVSGTLARAGDAEDLAAKLIATFGRSDAELAAMGAAAQRRVRERYSTELAAEEAEGVYRRALEATENSARAEGGLGALLGEVTRLERAWEEQSSRVTELEGVKDRLWADLRRAVGERDEACAEASRIGEAWEESRGRLIELEAVKDGLWNETQRLTRDRDAMRAEAQRLAGEWEAAAARVRELSDEVWRLGGVLREAQRERSAMQDGLSRLERAVEASQTQPVFKVLAKAGLVRRIGAGGAPRG